MTVDLNVGLVVHLLGAFGIGYFLGALLGGIVSSFQGVADTLNHLS